MPRRDHQNLLPRRLPLHPRPCSSTRAARRPSPASASSASRSSTPVPLVQGFERAAAIIKARGRPLTAFCACELRSPAPFSDAGFKSFNETYVRDARRHGASTTPQRRPIRSLAATSARRSDRPPSPPSTPSPSRCRRRGVAHLRGGGQRRSTRGRSELPRAHRALRRDQRGRDAGKGAFRARRDGAAPGAARLRLGAHHRDAGLHRARSLPVPADEIVGSGAARAGLTWHFCRPPVQGLEYEMDCRGVAVEHFVV